MEFAPKPKNTQENKEDVEFEDILISLRKKEYIKMSSQEKMNFLNWAVKKEGYLLHGSNTNNIKELEPRLANCTSKKFGNQKAVFANEDPIVTMFYALKNKDFEGISGASVNVDLETGSKKYQFYFNGPDASENICISNGSIYLLNRNEFMQGFEDGYPIDEWINKNTLQPDAELPIDINDFPFLSDIKYNITEKETFLEKIKSKFKKTQ